MAKDLAPASSVQEPIMKDVMRTQYDLSHLSMKCGAIGSLQALSHIRVVPGDSFNIDGSFVFRLSPLRQHLYLDANVDLFAFFVPDRHIYSNWVDFIKAGFDEGITLGTDTLAAQASSSYDCFGPVIGQATTVPRWLSRGTIQIWNKYFRDPSDATAAKADNYFTDTPSEAEARYGLSCAHLKRIWNTAINESTTSGDYSLPLNGGEVNLLELAALKGRLRTEKARDWFALDYRHILKHTWDTQVTIDADQRPELLMRSKAWLSGSDINGTDDATLGSWSGKSQGLMRISIPNKMFMEHGTIWIMALVRFPGIVANEVSYLVTQTEPTYAQIAGDPAIVRRSAPISLNANTVFQGGPNVVLGSTPHSQWYREQPHMVSQEYLDVAGHPFMNVSTRTTRNEFVYISPTEYDSVFKTLALKHWQSQGFISVSAKRFIPDVRESIFAGAE